MAGTTTVMCTDCGTLVTLPAVFQDVTFEGNAINLAVNCPRCHRIFDAAPADGSYSTVAGRLQLVKAMVTATRLIAEAVPTLDELHALHETVQMGQAQGLSPREIASQISGFEKFAKWAQENPVIATGVFTVTAAIITALGTIISQQLGDTHTDTIVNNTSVVIELPVDAELEQILGDLLD